MTGSEKWNHDIDMDKAHIAEMTNINLSLHTLSRCINALAKANGRDSGHVPYRESKLTRLLKDSLSGNAKIRLIATLSPSLMNVTESLNTLKARVCLFCHEVPWLFGCLHLGLCCSLPTQRSVS